METLKLDSMINNSIKLAYYKLNRHKELGRNSSLSIFEVAELLDTIKKAESLKSMKNHNIFFGMN